MTPLAQHILAKAEQSPEGSVLSPKEFLHLGSREAVDQTFTRYQDYNSALDLSDVEASLTEEIVKMLIEDIFNRAFVNW